MLKQLRFLAASDTLIIALQNGIGHHDALQRYASHFAVGITAQGGTLAGRGSVIQGGAGQTVIGYLPSAAKKDIKLLRQIAEVFDNAHIPTLVSNSIINSIWDKLIINVGINALTAIYNCRNGELLGIAPALEDQKMAVLEAARIAAAKGVCLSGDPVEMTVKVCRATSNNVSSMLQDVRKGRHTEIDAINGAIVREGKLLGIPTPVNEKLVKKVKGLTA